MHAGYASIFQAENSEWQTFQVDSPHSVSGGIKYFITAAVIDLWAPCSAFGFLRKQEARGNVITEWFSTCAARWYLCNSSSWGAEREGVGKPQRVQVAWQMLETGHGWPRLLKYSCNHCYTEAWGKTTLMSHNEKVPTMKQVMWQIPDQQRQGMAGATLCVTTVILGSEVR